MERVRSLVFGLALGLVGLLSSGRLEAQEPIEKPKVYTAEDVGRIFEKNCSHCHTVPDPRQELDRAWLDQVHRTA